MDATMKENDKIGIAQVGKPLQLAWNNRRVRSKENDKGEFFFFFEVEVNEEDWGWLRTIPRNANGEMVMWITNIGLIPEKPKKSKKPAKPQGPHGQLWRELHVADFINTAGVLEAIEEKREDVTESAWVILRRVFGVESLTFVGKDEIYAKFPKAEFPMIKVKVEDAMRRAGEQ